MKLDFSYDEEADAAFLTLKAKRSLAQHGHSIVLDTPELDTPDGEPLGWSVIVDFSADGKIRGNEFLGVGRLFEPAFIEELVDRSRRRPGELPPKSRTT